MVIQYHPRAESSTPAAITIANASGQEVARLSGTSKAGINTVVWSTRDRGDAEGAGHPRAGCRGAARQAGPASTRWRRCLSSASTVRVNVAGTTLTQKADYEDARLVDRRGTAGHQARCRRRCRKRITGDRLSLQEGSMLPRNVRVVVVVGDIGGEAQVRTTGQIAGTVRDPSGAVVPDAEIQIRDQAGITASHKSARDGGFVFVAVQPGRYTLTAIAKGFQPLVVETVTVETARASNIALQVEVAGVQEAVEVAGRATVIETSSTTISTTVTNQQIEKLPVGNRSVLAFALLIPGAQQNAARTPGTTSPSARQPHQRASRWRHQYHPRRREQQLSSDSGPAAPASSRSLPHAWGPWKK